MDEEDKPSREELKQRLRQKIKEGRNNTSSMSETLKKDPTTALLTLGVDDIGILNNSKQIVNSAKQMQKQAKRAIK